MPTTSEPLKTPALQKTLFSPVSDLPTNNSFRDPAFYENKKFPIHRWVPWIAGYSAAFVDSVIDKYLLKAPRTSVVLDPFAGVGTTLLQAILRGYDAVGFEINPYPALVANTKTTSLAVDIRVLEGKVRELKTISRSWPFLPPPAVEKPRLKTKMPFFSPSIENQVLHAITFIRQIDNNLVRDIFRTALGAVLVSVSNYSYEPSLGTRRSAGKRPVDEADFGKVLYLKCLEILEDIKLVKIEINDLNRIGRANVIIGNFFKLNSLVRDKYVDLIVTSPPYLNNYHYVRNTRPQLYWLSFISSPAEQKILETGNFGKYWQEVRALKEIPLAFEHDGLTRILKDLRSVRKEAGVYGGPGWANYVASYFNDTFEFYRILRRVMKRDAIAVVVIGNSIIQGIEIKVERIYADIAALYSFEVLGVDIIREKRVGSSITDSEVRRGANKKRVLYDAAVIARKR